VASQRERLGPLADLSAGSSWSAIVDHPEGFLERADPNAFLAAWARCADVLSGSADVPA